MSIIEQTGTLKISKNILEKKKEPRLSMFYYFDFFFLSSISYDCSNLLMFIRYWH